MQRDRETKRLYYIESWKSRFFAPLAATMCCKLPSCAQASLITHHQIWRVGGWRGISSPSCYSLTPYLSSSPNLCTSLPREYPILTQFCFSLEPDGITNVLKKAIQDLLLKVGGTTRYDRSPALFFRPFPAWFVICHSSSLFVSCLLCLSLSYSSSSSSVTTTAALPFVKRLTHLRLPL